MSDSNGFDAGLLRARRWRWWRRVGIAAAAAVGFVLLVGVPEFRVNHQRSTHGQIVRATYLAVTGDRTEASGRPLPLFRFTPLDTDALISKLREVSDVRP